MLKIYTSLCILFLQASLYAQTNKIQGVDTLVLVQSKMIAYCNGKIQQVAILNERMLVKDTIISILDKRVNNKEQEIKSYQVDIDTFKEQILVKNTEETIYKQQDQHQKTEIKQLRKKMIVLKIGLVAISCLEIYTLIRK